MLNIPYIIKNKKILNLQFDLQLNILYFDWYEISASDAPSSEDVPEVRNQDAEHVLWPGDP